MWYKNFIPHVASIAAPLFEKTSKRKLVWDDEATRAVNRLKGALIELPMLVRFDRELQTRVTTDASTVGVAAVLEQLHGDDWRPVAFWSRKLKDAETQVFSHGPGMAGGCGVRLSCMETLPGGSTFLSPIGSLCAGAQTTEECA